MAPLRGDMHPTVFLQHADKSAAVPFQTNSLLCINIHNKFCWSATFICAVPYRAAPLVRLSRHRPPFDSPDGVLTAFTTLRWDDPSLRIYSRL